MTVDGLTRRRLLCRAHPADRSNSVWPGRPTTLPYAAQSKTVDRACVPHAQRRQPAILQKLRQLVDVARLVPHCRAEHPALRIKRIAKLHAALRHRLHHARKGSRKIRCYHERKFMPDHKSDTTFAICRPDIRQRGCLAVIRIAGLGNFGPTNPAESLEQHAVIALRFAATSPWPAHMNEIDLVKFATLQVGPRARLRSSKFFAIAF